MEFKLSQASLPARTSKNHGEVGRDPSGAALPARLSPDAAAAAASREPGPRSQDLTQGRPRRETAAIPRTPE